MFFLKNLGCISRNMRMLMTDVSYSYDDAVAGGDDHLSSLNKGHRSS